MISSLSRGDSANISAAMQHRADAQASHQAACFCPEVVFLRSPGDSHVIAAAMQQRCSASVGHHIDSKASYD